MITKSMIKTWSKKKYHKHFFELQNCKHKSSISVFDIKKKEQKRIKLTVLTTVRTIPR